MRPRWGPLLLLLLGTGTNLHGWTRGFGLGIIAGEPTGLSAKTWLTDETAVDLAAAWSFVDGNALQLHADYLRHDFSRIRSPEIPGRVPLYYGIGVRVKLRSDGDGKGGEPDRDEVRVGIRIPLGISYLPRSAPLDAFLEVVPLLDLAPETDLRLNAAIGGRYYF